MLLTNISWDPGSHFFANLVTETNRNVVGLPNANMVEVTKSQVDMAIIKDHNKLVIRSDMISKYKQPDDLVEEENRG
jgi:hypothetical protein